MKHSLLTCILAITVLSVFSQETNHPIVKCHTTEMQAKLFERYPELKAESEVYGEQILKRVKEMQNEGIQKDEDPYIIPVVFHIIHENGPENISVAQIDNAVQVMTDDFNANSPLMESIEDEFQGIIGDVGIEFRLAKRDPEGNCTNGIIRTFSPLTNSGGENLKEVSPIWDRAKYMNIWVCKNIASGAAGYTYYPSSLAGDFGETNDGIVVRYDYVGGIEESSLTGSHTLTHEVGHWIDLPHLWGSTNVPGEASNCDTDDGVEDTPNTLGWTTCNERGETCGSLDNVQNFMEYSFCGRMFTEGQKMRMLASLTAAVAERNSLWTEENLIETGVLEDDQLCHAEFSVDLSSICVGETVQFLDQSYHEVENRTWIFEGGSPSVSTNQSPSVLYSVPGRYSVSLLVADSSGNQATRVEEGFIDVVDTSALSLPYSENFEAYTSLDPSENQALYVTNTPSESFWEISSEVGYDDTYSAVIRESETSSSFGAKSSLVSKTFQLSEVQGQPVLSFKRAAARSSLSGTGKLYVYISRNCGFNWNLRAVFDDEDLYTTEALAAENFIPNEADWATSEISLIGSLFFTEEFRIRFEYTGIGGGTVYLDDINLIDELSLDTEDEIGSDPSVAIYPNPATDRVNLKFRTGGSTDFEELLLWDVSGRLVKRINLANKSISDYSLNIQDITRGIYLLEINGNTGKSTHKLVVE